MSVNKTRTNWEWYLPLQYQPNGENWQFSKRLEHSPTTWWRGTGICRNTQTGKIQGEILSLRLKALAGMNLSKTQQGKEIWKRRVGSDIFHRGILQSITQAASGVGSASCGLGRLGVAVSPSAPRFHVHTPRTPHTTSRPNSCFLWCSFPLLCLVSLFSTFKSYGSCKAQHPGLLLKSPWTARSFLESLFKYILPAESSPFFQVL